MIARNPTVSASCRTGPIRSSPVYRRKLAGGVDEHGEHAEQGAGPVSHAA